MEVTIKKTKVRPSLYKALTIFIEIITDYYKQKQAIERTEKGIVMFE